MERHRGSEEAERKDSEIEGKKRRRQKMTREGGGGLSLPTYCSTE